MSIDNARTAPAARRPHGPGVRAAALLLAGWIAYADPAHGRDPVATPTPVTGRPAVRVDKHIWDFGKTWIDQPLRHEFTLQNVGDAPLIISQIEPPYGVSIVGDSPRTIGPGQSAALHVAIEAESLRGPYDRTIALHTNDPQNARLLLNLRGECRRYIDVTPVAAGFGRISGDTFSERVLTIRNNTDQPMRLTLPAGPTSDGKFAWQLIETMEGREYRLFVNTVPPLAPGTIRSEIVLYTNVDSQKEIRTSAYAIVPGRIEVSPAVVPLPQPSGDAPVATTQVVQFSNSGSSAVAITGLSCTDTSIATSYTVVQAGRRYRILVKFPANYKLPDGGAMLNISTDDSQQSAIEVPIGEGRQPRRVTGAPTSAPGEKRRPALDLLGKPAPTFALETRLGVPFSNEELAYHPATVLNFVAPNCGFCKKQLPVVEALRQTFEKQGVRFVNVAQTMRKAFTPEETEAVMHELGVNLELAIDAGNKVGGRFSVTGFPCLFVVDRRGVVEHVVPGNKADLSKTVSETLNRLLAGAPAPQEAAKPAAAPAGPSRQ